MLFGRVDPQTDRYLRGLNAPNMGRAVDIAVQALLQAEASTTSKYAAASSRASSQSSPEDSKILDMKGDGSIAQ